MNATVGGALVTSSHAAAITVLDGLRERGVAVSHVVSLADIEDPVPAVDIWAFHHQQEVEHVVIRCIDADMPDDMWVVRFGGTREELFQPENVAPLVAVGRYLARNGGADSVVVHCAAGVSRSTAATIVILAAAGLAPEEAVTCAWAAQQASFRWREPREFQPNRRILDISSEQMYGDHRLTEAYERWASPH